MRTVYCAYMDFDNNKTEIFVNSEIIKFDGFDILKNINCSQESVVFVNDLKVFAQMFPGGTKYGENYKKLSQNRGDVLEYYMGKTKFRSFSALIAMESIDTLKELFPEYPICVAMYKYLEKFGEPEKVRYSLANQTKKIFYAPIQDELWEETKKNEHYYYDLETYDHMVAGNKAGLLTRHEFKTLLNMVSFDKKSAFPSIMINCDMFPIGKYVKTKPKASLVKVNICEYLKKKKWFKIIIKAYSPEFKLWYDTDKKLIAMDISNVMSAYKMGLINELFKVIENNETWFYYNQKQCYLSKIFRDRFVESYAKKSVLKKGTFERFLEKTMLDMLYGKGLQDHKFESIKEVQKHFRGRGYNYMDPAWSNLARGMVEFEIIKAIYDNGLTFDDIYADTDGLKAPDTPKIREYFENENKRIIDANRRSGYDIDIGIWDLEEEIDELYVIKPKIYCFNRKDKSFDCVHAGVRESDINKLFEKIKGKEMIYIKKKGFPFIQHFYKLKDGEMQEYMNITFLKGE